MLFESMINKIKSPSILSDITLSSLIYQLWIKVIESRQEKTMKKKDSERVQESIEYMIRNLSEKITVLELAEMCYFSKAQYTRLCKKYTGLTPYDYLIRLRISKTKRLLDETDMSLEEICSHTGFSSPPHLIACFKKHEGTTPLRYKDKSHM